MNRVEEIVVSLRMKWWVRPYLFALKLAAPFIAIALGRSDARIDALCERQADFIFRRGVRVISA